MLTSHESRAAAEKLYGVLDTALDRSYASVRAEKVHLCRPDAIYHVDNRFLTLANKLRQCRIACMSEGGILTPKVFDLASREQSAEHQAFDYASECFRDPDSSACVCEEAKTLLYLMLRVPRGV